jgi:transaldolase
MGASFRNTSQITELAGCDLLTISPELLQKLAATDAPVTRKLSADIAQAAELQKLTLNEKTFRLMLNDDAMGTEKLAEGIRGFCLDSWKLERMINELC